MLLNCGRSFVTVEKMRLVVASFRFECEHASTKVLTLNWHHSRRICVQIHSMRSHHLPEIFKEYECVTTALWELCIDYFHVRIMKENRFLKQCAFESCLDLLYKNRTIVFPCFPFVDVTIHRSEY